MGTGGADLDKISISKISFRYGQEHPALPDWMPYKWRGVTLRSTGEN